MVDEARLRQRFEAVRGQLRGQLDERGLRLLAAAEARAAGHGGIAAVARATGIARSTIGRGLADLDQPALPPGQVRRAGSGRKPVQEKDPTLLADLRRLVEPATLGDPMRPLLWVSKSHTKLADELCAMGHPISPNTVGKLLPPVDQTSPRREKAPPRPQARPGMWYLLSWRDLRRRSNAGDGLLNKPE